MGRQGVRVLVTGRSEGRGRAVLQQLRGAGNRSCAFIGADLSTVSGVRSLAQAVRSRVDRLDVLVNNAGAWFETRGETSDGVERTWALNHLAPYLLTHLLWEPLAAAPAGRVVTVASDAHRGGGLDWDDLGKAAWSRRGWPAYQQSKWANVVFTKELARRLRGHRVTANCLHPGFVASSFGQGNGPAMRAALMLTRPLQISARRGAATVVWAALSPDVAGMSGEYLKRRRVALPDPRTNDAADGRRLWDHSAAQVGIDAAWPAA
jgi:NAD(P)-dependent dehydrogenase (short-subunit alcohol dehydrogenase family)